MTLSIPKFANTQGAIFLAVGAVVAVGLFLFLKKQVGEAADAVGGVVSGNNAATAGTAYQGTGIVGTVAAVANSASGGLLSDLGESIGGKLYDWFGDDPPPDQGTRKQLVSDSYYARGILP